MPKYQYWIKVVEVVYHLKPGPLLLDVLDYLEEKAPPGLEEETPITVLLPADVVLFYPPETWTSLFLVSLCVWLP